MVVCFSCWAIGLSGRCCFSWWTICSAFIRFTCIPWIHSWSSSCEALIWSVRTKVPGRGKEAWCRGSRKRPVKSFKANVSPGTWTFCTRWRRLPKAAKAWTWWTSKVPPHHFPFTTFTTVSWHLLQLFPDNFYNYFLTTFTTISGQLFLPKPKRKQAKKIPWPTNKSKLDARRWTTPSPEACSIIWEEVCLTKKN